MLRRVHGARVTHMGERHRDALLAAADLGHLLGKASGSRPEARALLSTALMACVETLGAAAAQTVRTRELLENLDDEIDADDDDDSEARGEVVALLAHIYVAPHERRKGAARGSLVLLALEAWAAGATALEALVPVHVPAGQVLAALLASAGYAQTGAARMLRGNEHVRMRLERPADVLT